MKNISQHCVSHVLPSHLERSNSEIIASQSTTINNRSDKDIMNMLNNITIFITSIKKNIIFKICITYCVYMSVFIHIVSFTTYMYNIFCFCLSSHYR